MDLQLRKIRDWHNKEVKQLQVKKMGHNGKYEQKLVV